MSAPGGRLRGMTEAGPKVGLRLAAAFGPDQPQRFLTAWLGPPSRDVPESTTRDLAAAYFPAALAEWHRQVSRWHSPVLHQNRVLTRREMRGDMLLVAEENEANWLWGVRHDSDNPWVWERDNEPRARWTATGERLDEFLWHFTLAEAVCGRYRLGAIDVTSADLARFTSAWTALNVKSWRWPGPNQTLWTWDGLLAWTVLNAAPDSPVTDASAYNLNVGARSNQDLLQVDDSGIAWAWDSRNWL